MAKPAKRAEHRRPPSATRRESWREALSLLDRMPVALWTTDADLVLTFCAGAPFADEKNPPDRYIGRSLVEFTRNQPQALRAHRQALHGFGVSYETTTEGRTHQVHVRPLRGEMDRIEGVVAAALDISDRKRSEKAQQFLADAGALLSSSLEFETTLANVARLVVPQLADWCSTYVLKEDGSIERVALVQGDSPEAMRMAVRYRQSHPVTLNDDRGVGKVLRTGEPEFTPWLPDRLLREPPLDPEDARLVRELGINSVIILPLVARGRTLGAVTFAYGHSGRRYDDYDLGVAKDLAGRMSSAIDNARLYREARQEIERRRQAEAALAERSERAMMYQAALRELATAPVLDLESRLRQVTEKVSRVLRVDRVSVWRFTADQSELQCEDLFSDSKGGHDRGIRLQTKDYPRYFSALRTSRALGADDAVLDPRTSEFAETYLKPLGIRSMLDVPVRLHGQLAGVVCHEHTGTPRRWTPEEESFASSISDLVSLAYEAAEHRAAEEALRESERRGWARSQELETIMETTPAIVWVVHDPGSETITGNRASNALLRVSAGRNVSKTSPATQGSLAHFQVWRDGRPLGPHELPLQRAAQGEEVRNYEEEIVFDDGARVRLFGNAIPLRNPDGSVRGAVGAFIDITDRVRAEEKVRELNEALEHRVGERTAQLEETLQEMNAFSYTVAHDLRAPLRAMTGLSQVLLEDYAGRPLDVSGQDLARRIADSARRMDRLIQDLLGYSRLSRGEFTPEQVDLGEVVRQAIAAMGAEMAQRKAELVVREPFPCVRAHRVPLGQVVQNLLSNAVKFVSPDVRPNVKIWCETRGDRARLWIEDNGIGISAEHQDRIFRVFERLNRAEAYPGTGIGLSIVRRAAEKMGGAVGVESTPGQGSRFWLELPLS